jgi:pimeloyl-ACP methyl ester carboxylesterase
VVSRLSGVPTVRANDVDFEYLEWGEAGAPLALLLHGFPDSAHTWRHLGPNLAAAGFHAVAPFMRGYAPTTVPADGRYQTGVLALDAVELEKVLRGSAPSVLVGHDWGATAVWLAAVHGGADAFARVVGMAVPPGGAMAGAFFDYGQLQRSWYMFFFQHGLADMAVPMNDLAFIDGLWADWSPGYDATEDLALLKPSLRAPENLGAALGYYRATLSGVGVDPALSDVQGAGASAPPQPALYLHGRDDGCIGVGVADGSGAFLTTPGSRAEVVDGVGHFLHLEQPDVVNRLIIEFLTA